MGKGMIIEDVRDFCDWKEELNRRERRHIIGSVPSLLKLSKRGEAHEIELLEGLFFEKMSYIKNNLDDMRKSLILKVTLQSCKEFIETRIEMPYCTVLSDAIYVILISVHAHDRQPFLVNVAGKKWGFCQEGEKDPSLISLNELKLEIGSQIELIYDFDEQYIFDIEVEEVREHSEIYDEITILRQKGIGIFEGNHDLLKMYYRDSHEFNAYMKETILDEQDYSLEERDQQKITSMCIDEYRISYEE